MNIYAFPPIAAALDGAASIVQFLTTVLQPLAGANSAALSVVLITLLVRLVLIPVGLSQARAQRMRRRLAPRLAELQRRHGKNPERLRREMAALYADENASPLAGCLPLLIQAPILSLLYGVFILPTINGHPNTLLTQTLIGAPLGTSLATAVTRGDDPVGVVVGFAVVAVIATVALISRRRTLSTAAASPGGSAGAPALVPLTAGTSPGQATPGVPAIPASVLQAMSWLPLITVVVAAFVPLAASLYLVVTTTWALAEREVLRRVIR